MADTAQTLLVEDVSHGGGMDAGHSVFFDARLADGAEVRMMLPHTHVSAFIAKMMAFAGAAQREREGRELAEQGPVDVTQMLACQQIKIAPLADLTGVALQFQIQPGVVMVFPLQTRVLPQLSAALMKWHSGLQETTSALDRQQ